MADETPTPGPVEAAYRAWVSTLGTLSPRQLAEAERLYAVARQMDMPTERPAAAVSSLSRAIGKVADALRDEKNAGGAPVPAGATPPADVVDEVARRRRERLAGGGAAS